MPSAKKRFQFLSKPHGVVLHHRDLQSFGGTSISAENKQKTETPSERPLFSLQVSRAKPETAPRLVPKQELQLEGWTAASVHMQTGQVLLIQIRYLEKLQQDGPQGSLPGLLET